MLVIFLAIANLLDITGHFFACSAVSVHSDTRLAVMTKHLKHSIFPPYSSPPSNSPSKNASMRAAINQQLTESGEKEKLKAMIRERLRDHGWADNLKQYTKGKK